MIFLIAGFIISLISLLIGYSLGKNNRIIPENTQQKINQIFTRIVEPKTDVGAVERPDIKQNYYRDNPQAKVENDMMDEALTNLQ